MLCLISGSHGGQPVRRTPNGPLGLGKRRADFQSASVVTLPSRPLYSHLLASFCILIVGVLSRPARPFQGQRVSNLAVFTLAGDLGIPNSTKCPLQIVVRYWLILWESIGAAVCEVQSYACRPPVGLPFSHPRRASRAKALRASGKNKAQFSSISVPPATSR